ncbi:MAG: VanZ family protein [Rhodoferax sp.]|jgi:VanZ family protein|uniref:VanZ family protein n=1 Tax=Rhodoferax sp. TaxID=50421 RepID=UPI003C764593
MKNHRFAQGLLLLQVLLLFVGTQMPGALRAELEASMHSPWSLSSWAHFVIFVGMAAVAYARPMAWPWHRVLLAALFLALVSEALQFFATDRHPRWLDVGIDMAGAVVGLGLVMVRVRWIAASLRSSQ